jgi:hypothetical protein
MKNLFAFIFFIINIFSPCIYAGELKINFTGRIESEKLIYQPFDSPSNSDGTSSYEMATTYLREGYPAGHITNKEPKEAVVTPIKDKSLTDNATELTENHKKFKSEYALLKNKILDNFRLVKGYLSQKQRIDIPETTKVVLTEKPAEPSNFSYVKFIACLNVNYPMLLNLLYFQNFKIVKESTKLEALLSAETPNQVQSNSSGMLCGNYLGEANFSIASWKERAQVAQLFLKLSQSDNAEANIKIFLRQLIALHNTNSPVKNSEVWKYLWLRSSQLAYVSGKIPETSLQELAQEFVQLEASGKYYQFEGAELRFKWSPAEIEAHVSAGENFAKGKLP